MAALSAFSCHLSKVVLLGFNGLDELVPQRLQPFLSQLTAPGTWVAQGNAWWKALLAVETALLQVLGFTLSTR